MKSNAAQYRKGFTLIELLIVIALLGALAIGLIATIDPFEQLKKGRDTATRNTVTEFYNANLRYFGTKGQFAWGTDPFAAGTSLSNLTTTITDLVDAGELKNNFIAAAGFNRLERITVNSTASDDLSVCFVPESKNFRLDSNTIYQATDATLRNDCKAQVGTGATDCAWCIH